MDRIVLSTVVYRSPEEVFPYLESFSRYPRYSEHLESVDQRGDGGAGTEYDLRLSWRKFGYTAHSEVTEIAEPETLSWRLMEDVDARGEWRVEPAPEAAPEGEETASRVYFEAIYDPHSADGDAISLPTFISLDWLVSKIQPRLLGEAKEVVARLVADIEGERREVDLAVHESPQ
ncbi:SRPBCC family protein [Saliphagus sp. LR7]|uniref:SRPBCC family protein n=1 Tax=Saliphagus sp. LR7 TaxID=2282654 RepID=UPI000DF726B5|nr:SRPBCC family protein [Saliphagus sp. LR7]